MRGDNLVGAFNGRKLIQRRGEIGGSRSVFVKLQGIKNELIYPTFGGMLKNPFKGAAKIFAGDLCEYRTNANGVKPEVFILKTYKVTDNVASSTTINILRDGFTHTPFVGDKIGVAPDTIGGAISSVLTIKSVKAIEGKWTLTVDKAATISPNTVLVEADDENNMLVKNINSIAPSDYDMYDIASDPTNDEDFDNARYMFTPALGGLMYIHKMSPMPPCVLKLNRSKINGWYKIDFYDSAENVAAAASVAEVAAETQTAKGK